MGIKHEKNQKYIISQIFFYSEAQSMTRPPQRVSHCARTVGRKRGRVSSTTLCQHQLVRHRYPSLLEDGPSVSMPAKDDKTPPLVSFRWAFERGVAGTNKPLGVSSKGMVVGKLNQREWCLQLKVSVES